MSEVTYSNILYEVKNRCALITFNRVKEMNAWNKQMGREVRHALARAEDDKNVFGIVITGNGKAFCPGADMMELSQMGKKGDVIKQEKQDDGLQANPGTLELPEAFAKGIHAYFATIAKPIIAAVNGPAAGLGFSIALRCDMRFFSESAFVSASFSKLGLPAEASVAWILPKLIGLEASFDILLSSRKVFANELKELRLATRICKPETLVQEAVDYINELSESCSPASMAMIKAQLYRDLHRDPDTSLEEVTGLIFQSIKSADFREGVKAFMEKRKPEFEGYGKN